MTQPLNLAGIRYGRLTAVERATNTRGGQAVWVCQCDCGNTKSVLANHLRRGAVVSCGCYHKDNHTTHGQYKSPEYGTWVNIKGRCLNPNSPKYPDYGGRGIQMCDRWKSSFAAFLADMGPRPAGRYTIERLDNDGHYEPGNCIWATYAVQSRNKRPKWNKRANA